MRFWNGIAGFAGLVGIVLSWNQTGFSRCAKDCANKALGSECSKYNGDNECICTSSQLYSKVACCVVMRCEPGDQQSADKLVNNTCIDANVTLLTDLKACAQASLPTLTRDPNYSIPPFPGDPPLPRRNNQAVIVIVLIIVIVFAITTGFCIFCYRRGKRRAAREQRTPQQVEEPVQEAAMPPASNPPGEYPSLLDSRMIESPPVAELEAIPARQSLNSATVAK